MLIKKDKKRLFSISFFNSFFNKNFFSIFLKFLGFIQILFIFIFIYMAVAFDKNQIKELLFATAQKTYWFGKTLTNLPLKWANNVSSNHSILDIEISPKNYQLIMTLKDEAIKNKLTLQEHKKRVPAVISYKKNKFDVRLRLKGDGADSHLADSKWSMRITVNNDLFLFCILDDFLINFFVIGSCNY